MRTTFVRKTVQTNFADGVKNTCMKNVLKHALNRLNKIQMK